MISATNVSKKKMQLLLKRARRETSRKNQLLGIAKEVEMTESSDMQVEGMENETMETASSSKGTTLGGI